VRTALPLPDDHWRSRWLVLPGWHRLHRVADIEWDDEDMISGHGTTLCGQTGRLRMPGIFSRLGLPRCAHCCRLAGVPRGDGAPANVGIEEGP
jgi:hypothetical protein